MRDGRRRPPRSGMRHSRPGGVRRSAAARYYQRVVIFFEILLGLASLLIVWFALYVVYRLVTDES